MLYHVHQSMDGPDAKPDRAGRARQTALRVAELTVEDGELVAHRDRYA